MATLSLAVTVPFDIGDYVYRTADLATLEEHQVFYSDMPRYRVVGYEVNVIENDEGTTVADYDNAIIKSIQIGDDDYDGPNEYIYYGILTLETPDLIEKINAIKDANLV